MPEKRSFIRYAVEAKICFKSEGDVSKAIEGQLLDISSSGLSGFFKESIDVNTIIQFDLAAISIGQHLIGKGKVVHVTEEKTYAGKGFKIGVEFLEVNKEIVLRFISENQRKIREEMIKKWQSKPVDDGLF